MDFLPSPTTTIGFIFPFLLFLYYFLKIRGHTNTNNKIRPPPEAAGAWPLIGHLCLLNGPQLPHVVLGDMADKYGPIFTIRLGIHRAVIVSGPEVVKDCFTTNDKAFSNRPKSIAVEHMGYNYAMFAFSPYGPFWRKIRKIATLELLSNYRLAALGHVRVTEVKNSIREIYEVWVKNENCVVNMMRWFEDLTLNLTVRVVAGKRSDGKGFSRTLREFFELMGVFTVADAVPLLRRLDFGGHEKAMRETAKRLDEVLQEWLEEHKRRRLGGERATEHDFMEVMLGILDGDACARLEFDADTINKATCLGLTLGGTDTITTTLTWTLALLLNNKNILKKAQDELDLYVGRERRVEESDLKNLVYLQAIVKESLRLCTPTQLSPPRETTEDCNIDGYHVPAGTRLFVNIWKLHRDPRVWPDPMEFLPERFLTTHKDVDVRGKHFELMPFGSGRRVCPGISFALQMVQFTLASLLHAFEIATPCGELIDMTASFGFTNAMEKPIEVVLSPRLPPKLYG
ncbi:cytochrome P450, family 82, subfamily C, polypeptide 4 [Actinidia rufa]|uniref:Cytochrome P450, family 82, subfamily C, polypeptide 4 n=1 Tax=Actinidia rufa TaxID=165716 RepID=A0A7J0DDU0_9ERIC|nr:cytochrome P450, family 82, subfamily C, polypeptide 4 [Actinidia rufa]